MQIHPVRVSEVLKSLTPQNQEDLSVLQTLLRCAMLPKNAELKWLLENIPEEAKRYFHGLVEALEIYQSIHGQALAVQTLSLRDKSVHEIRQIRDMCIEDGLRSIY